MKVLVVADPAMLYTPSGGGGPPPGGEITTGGVNDVYADPLAPVLTELDGLYLDASGFLRTGAPPSDSILRLAYQSAESVFDNGPYAMILWSEATTDWQAIFGVGGGSLPTTFIDAFLPIAGGPGLVSSASVPVQEDATIPGAHGPDPNNPASGWTLTYQF